MPKRKRRFDRAFKLAAMTEEPIWRRVRPPLRSADEAVARRAAGVLSRLEG
ncbi:MAG: hypothetical protein P4L90_23730 [Rhodopila sp.]|nr:hypothetical protein [Rhodopila sp.]